MGDFLGALGTAARGPQESPGSAPRTSSPRLPAWVSAAPERVSDWLAARVGLKLGSRSLSSFLPDSPSTPFPFCFLLPHPSVHTFGAAQIPFLSHRQGHTESNKVNKNHTHTHKQNKNPVFFKNDSQDRTTGRGDNLDQQYSAGDGKVGDRARNDCQMEWE